MQDGRRMVQCDLIPRSWYKALTVKGGRPDLAAATVLGYVQQEYRLADIRGDERELAKLYSTGLDASYSKLRDELGLTRMQARYAIERLETAGVVKRRFRTDCIAGQLTANIMSLELDFEVLERLTFPEEG